MGIRLKRGASLRIRETFHLSGDVTRVDNLLVGGIAAVGYEPFAARKFRRLKVQFNGVSTFRHEHFREYFRDQRLGS